MRLFALALFALGVVGPSVMAVPCSTKDMAPLLHKLFSSLGQDCNGYVSLFSKEAKYYHQHDGYKNASDLMKNCQNYAAFCPAKQCRFLQNGEASIVARGNSCHLLVPYLWSEIPANNRAKGNLEPHTGWEYIIATPDSESEVSFRMNYFAEIETSYSVAFNWAKSDDTPSVVAQSALKLLSLGNSASKGECNSAIAPILTKFFNEKSSGGNVWRQQGDAVVLAAGGVCHLAVPYSAQVGAKLKTGHYVLTLKPSVNNAYLVIDAVEFPRSLL